MSKRRFRIALIAGFAAGTLATFAQMALWWITSIPVLPTLLRDARLTAAIVLGRAILPTPSTFRWDVMLVATLIHFTLSVGYAIPTYFIGRWNYGTALLAGGVYGLAIYGINLYGFTLIFPWFAVTRGWITVLTHIVFGLALAAGCKLLRTTN